MNVRLQRLAEEHVVFDDESYRWGFLICWRIHTDHVDEREALEALIALPRYRAGIGTLSDFKALAEKKVFTDEHTHGPFPLGAITPNAFVRTEAVAVRNELDQFAAVEDGDRPPHPVVVSRYARYVDALVEGDASIFKLTVDPSKAEEWGWIYHPFLEHVSIRRADRTTTLLMSGAD